MRYLVIIGAVFGTILMFLLATASSNTSGLAVHYWELFALNGLMLLVLLGILVRQLLRLRWRLKQQVFGAKLTFRLVLMFATLTIVPGTLIYTVSVQFLTRSIEGWFNVNVEKALDRGLALGQMALHHQLDNLVDTTSVVAARLHDDSGIINPGRLGILRAQYQIQELALFNTTGRLIAMASAGRRDSPVFYPDGAMLKEAFESNYRGIENDIEGGLLLRSVQRVEDIKGAPLLLQAIQPVPKALADDAELVERVRADYKQLSLSRAGLKVIYSLTLTLTMLLALLLALALAFVLSDRLSAPLRALAAGTRAVAQGDFSQRQPVTSRDELGILTQSFNLMTRQLAEASETVDRNQSQLEAAKGYLEGVLVTLTSGVLTFDERFRLRAVNPSASHILGLDLERLRGVKLNAWADDTPELEGVCTSIQQGFANEGQRQWQYQLDWMSKNGRRVILLRGARLQRGPENGVVVVFDDITELMQAQRDAAWGEVAKRLAHEIKNPLTPIQLSAERIQHRLSDKLEQADADMLDRATKTIVKQVHELKKMVDAFKDYARQPASKLKLLDLNQLLGEVLVLYEATPFLHLQLPETPLWVMGDATLLRQVMHNLLQNAQDAVLDQPIPQLSVEAWAANHKVMVMVADNGCGIPPDMLSRVFEPYVTTKQKGTGLGLAIVKKIIDEHSGLIHITNIEPHGVRVAIELPLAEAPATA
ncbi:ATP-binding protein [Chitinivorax sp. B]|uniref:sensor histidine kinase n=1 Tax=Chitinivorax sp. B TaxID=2502235 RepID=UPI0010F9B817|nr:ATP-binding protein [Chitinivorax sp. B]